MKLLIDTNVVLDVLLKRAPFYTAAADVLRLVEQGNIMEYVSASTITDIYYIASRQIKDRAVVKDLLGRLLKVVSIAAVTEQEIKCALDLDWLDFEDSVQYAVSQAGEMDGIVTRNPDDYKYAGVNIWLPEDLLETYFRNFAT
ncbi:PIN domain-containing protein [Oscillospiraceae bacterium 42-9]|uniref:PIN domain-containing protein n=1 Tax=Acutalibacter sp. 1XD8-36 TaxID=2320852 RepID=UPI0014122E5B|nr:PIN domain-containing protein [Acutalibacter sp. 1XD8-36]NBJ90167.1 PIN domain-containing protein [Acutalibacter sp. 1XD8-36]